VDLDSSAAIEYAKEQLPLSPRKIKRIQIYRYKEGTDFQKETTSRY
jgi:hypothetical protein